MKEARDAGEKMHHGIIFDLNVEKNSDLPIGDPLRKWKTRVVYQGNAVRDEHWEFAVFQELSSSPAAMEAGKCADIYGMAPGMASQISDAEGASTQAEFKGVPSWVDSPSDQ